MGVSQDTPLPCRTVRQSCNPYHPKTWRDGFSNQAKGATMVDISRIDLQTLDKENLEKVKLMLDISKIQQDIAESQVRVSKSNLDIESIRQSITQSQATVEKIHQDVAESRASVEQIKANTKKIEKEARMYPYVTLASAMIGGLIVFVLTRVFA